MTNNIKQTLKTIIGENFSINPETIMDDFTFDDFGMDILDIIEFIMMVEEEFNIEIDEYEASELNTIQDVVNIIKKQE